MQAVRSKQNLIKLLRRSQTLILYYWRGLVGLEEGISSGLMPEMQDFHFSLLKDNPVIDVERRVLKPPDTRVAAHGRAEIGEVLQQVNVVEKRVGETFGGPGMVLPGPTHDLYGIC
jgi:hypothetical protein